ncbi:MAG: hypothetical protein DMG05_10610 [Acidobacteria bacterium]|nr:MAG: hypothetical protein DMG05_10610 [Acidobacteriota bacterium]
MDFETSRIRPAASIPANRPDTSTLKPMLISNCGFRIVDCGLKTIGEFTFRRDRLPLALRLWTLNLGLDELTPNR